jgi:hypothetical protein
VSQKKVNRLDYFTSQDYDFITYHSRVQERENQGSCGRWMKLKRNTKEKVIETIRE